MQSWKNKPKRNTATYWIFIITIVYLVILDYFSMYFKLTSTSETIKHFKHIFAGHEIPEVMCSNNGPQFVSQHFTQSDLLCHIHSLFPTDQ